MYSQIFKSRTIFQKLLESSDNAKQDTMEKTEAKIYSR